MLTDFKETLQKSGEVYLRVKVRPQAAQTQIKGVLDDETVKIDVAAVPERGKANAELIACLAREFAVSKEQVKILSGAGERTKLVKIQNPKFSKLFQINAKI